ncbi:MAG: DUF5069 domain-containing protein [Puniceicoccaceae bacterium]|nr:MAG: DUF5069 domain-containing protein [Puniceicoccaceae bacterium]
MMHHDYQKTLRRLHSKAVRQYRDGGRDPGSYFNEEETAALGFLGASPQCLYDYAEDWVTSGEPDFATVLMVQAVRHDYFHFVMGGKRSRKVVKESSLPAKTDEVRGLAWLPRLIAKAHAKLRGELPDSLMYGCGGDRPFLRRHNVHLAEFLRAAWHFEGNDDALVDWFFARSPEL